MNPLHAVSLAVLFAACTIPALALAKTSDRNQPMTLDADRSDCNLTNDDKCVFSGNVVIQQGTLDIRANDAEILRRNGNIHRVILTGRQAQMKQLMDDNSPVDAHADRIEYDTANEIIILIGNYTLTSPRGSNRGQRMEYNTRTGQMHSGGDGSRVRTVIPPKSPAPGGDN